MESNILTMVKLEYGIEPLVNILNNIAGIKTQYSCHGHIGRPEAWVIFSCEDLYTPHRLWENFKTVNGRIKLSYYWTARPHFTFYEGMPGFIVEAHPVGFLTSLRKGKLLDDIKNLSELLFMGENKENKITQNDGYYKDKSPVSSFPASPGVFSLAAGASVSIRRNLFTTPVTFNKLCHEVIYQIMIQKKRGIVATVMASLKNSLCLWHLAETLRTFYFEGAYNSYPEVDGYFLNEKQIILKIRN